MPDPAADLGESLRKAGGSWKSPWGHEHQWESFWAHPVLFFTDETEYEYSGSEEEEEEAPEQEGEPR